MCKVNCPCYGLSLCNIIEKKLVLSVCVCGGGGGGGEEMSSWEENILWSPPTPTGKTVARPLVAT